MIKVKFPKNNRRMNEVFNTIDESKFNHELLKEILSKSFNENIDSYELEFHGNADAQGNYKSQSGQYFRVETDEVVKYILITAKSCKDTRNGYIAAKMPLCIRAWFYDNTKKEKYLEVFLTDTETKSSVNDYHTFIYRVSKTFGVKLLGEEKLPYLKYDAKSKKHEYRKKKILLDQPINNVHDIKIARDNFQKRNIGNKSSYILEADDYIIIYAKVDANSEFEMVYLASIINSLAKNEGKQTYLYQVEEIYSQSFGKDNIKFLKDQGVNVIEDLQKYEDNPDIVLDESKTSRNQAEFYRNLLKKYNNGSDYKCCYFCGDDFQDTLIASHIQRVTDINNLDIPFSEKREKAVDADNGFWLCPVHDKYLENGYIYFVEDKLHLKDNLTEKQKEKIIETFYLPKITDSLYFGENEFEIIKIKDKESFDVRIHPNHYNDSMHKYLEEHRKRVSNSEIKDDEI